MRVTIDSTEPLGHALDVVGAMYGVTLQQASAADSVPVTDSAPTPEAAPAPTAPVRSSGRRRGRRPAPAKAIRADAGTVRAWAVENGYQVSTRGQLSKAVLAAYTDAQTG